MRFRACISVLALSAASLPVILAVMGVRVRPGLTQLTRTFCGA